jgi:hypothetical protein
LLCLLIHWGYTFCCFSQLYVYIYIYIYIHNRMFLLLLVYSVTFYRKDGLLFSLRRFRLC